MRNLFDIMGGELRQDEIIGDLFAGGGGASSGIRMALGRDPDFAVNHNPKAVAMHTANHPDTEHFTEDVWSVTPSRATRGRPVGLLWASPDCTHFSKAKGGAPHRDERIRSLAMVLTDKWIPEARPRVIIMENVEEFRSWCDLIPKVDAKGNPVYDKKTGLRVMVPDKSKIDENGHGNLYKAWLRKFRRYGYKVQDKEMRACDYGSPTIRKRLFIIARCDGQPITWPKPTHGDPKSEAVKSGRLLPWRTAAECIDWSIPCPSIFDTAAEIKAKYGVRANRPLAEKTLKRIAEGIRRYVLEAENPFVVNLTHGVRIEDVAEPMKTVTGANRGEKAVVSPVISSPAHSKSTGRSKYVWAPGEPLRTVTSGGGFSLVTPHLTEHANGSSQRNFDAQEPLRTQCAQVKGGHFALVSPLLEAHYAGQGSKALRVPDIQEPMRTVPTENRFGLVSPTLVQTGYGEREGQAPRVPGLDKPLGTAVAGGVKHALVGAALVGAGGPSYGGKPVSTDRPMGTLMTENHQALAAASLIKNNENNAPTDPDAPLHTITTGGRHIACSAFLAKHFGGVVGAPLGQPAPTVTTVDHNAVVAAHIDRPFGMSKGNDVAAPLGTTTADGGGHSALVATNLSAFYGKSVGQDMEEPALTVTSKERHALVASNMVKMRGTNTASPSDEPLHTVSAGGLHHAEVRAFLMKYYSEGGQDQAADDPMHTLTTKARMGLVTVEGEEYVIADIGMRMLQPRELFRAQGFPDSYIIDMVLIDDKWVPLSKTDQVRFCGNSVCPDMAAALVLANVELRTAEEVAA
ncbi:MAG: DNA cytosine methyltransferase [Pseudodesulfovibrio sp.]|uniref:DNA cytosine methyltransferase n=1 Tax=Pseudodesulfovibrio sp. TaxID=2035812 RepID=UPI003D0FC83D